MKNYLILFFSLVILNISAVTDPYTSVVDRDVYISDQRILIVQAAYDFDHGKAHIANVAEPFEWRIIECTVINGSLESQAVFVYHNYSELVQSLLRYPNLAVLRPVVELEAEKFWHVVNEKFTDFFTEMNIGTTEVTNISSVFVIDSVKDFSEYYIVQVDIKSVNEGQIEYFRKTLVIHHADLIPYSDPDSFYSPYY